jgi:flagellar biosynthesis GTPase FlhF
MVFQIRDFNKNKSVFDVVSNSGEQMYVSGLQIVGVMIKGYEFTNAYLTSKGFAIVTPSGTRYIQLSLDVNTQAAIHDILAKKKAQEQEILRQQQALKEQQAIAVAKEAEARKAEALARQEAEQKRIAQQKEIERINMEKNKAMIKEEKRKVGSNENNNNSSNKHSGVKIEQTRDTQNKRIMYRGTLYLSDVQLCKKYNRDVEKFRALRLRGYSVDESLGLKPLRPVNEVTSVAQMQKTLDQMARARGEY